VPSELKRIIIAGRGGFGTEVENFMRGRGITVHGFLDDTQDGCTKIDAYEYQEGDEIIVAISDPRGREAVVKRLTERKAVFHGLHLHLGVMTAQIAGGCVLMPNSVVSAFAEVAAFVHVGLASLVGHHVKLGAFCTLSSQVDLTGHVEVGVGTFFGSGARVLPGVKIGSYCTIGAGAVVVDDVPDGATVYAAPARRL
jgi:sugar O-acyltransferase (sialic acid O-acetyltransferase NeuD family)